MPGLSIVDDDNGVEITRSQGSKPTFEHADFKDRATTRTGPSRNVREILASKCDPLKRDSQAR
jgi:hypothetical protein